MWPFKTKTKQPKRSYDAASHNPRQASFKAFGQPRSETSAASLPIRIKARQAYANNEYVRAGVEALVNAIVGTGITPAYKGIGDKWDVFNKTLDTAGLSDGYGLQASMVRSLIVDGEALAIKQALGLLQLDVDQLDAYKTSESPLIRNGVEFNSKGQRVAFWILPDADSHNFRPSKRVLAKNVVHLFRSDFAGQVRGVSWLAPILKRVAEISQTEHAVNMSIRTSALFAGFIRTTDEQSGVPIEHDNSGDISLEAGALVKLGLGQDITFSNPAESKSAVDFLKDQLHAVSAGLGVPAFMLTGNVADANYSSLRAALIAFRSTVERIQHTLVIPQLCVPIWHIFEQSEKLNGNSSIPTPQWHPPALPVADDMKTVDADIRAIEAGLKSRRQALAERGYSLEQIDADISTDTFFVQQKNKTDSEHD